MSEQHKDNVIADLHEQVRGDREEIRSLREALDAADTLADKLYKLYDEERITRHDLEPLKDYRIAADKARSGGK